MNRRQKSFAVFWKEGFQHREMVKTCEAGKPGRRPFLMPTKDLGREVSCAPPSLHHSPSLHPTPFPPSSLVSFLREIRMDFSNLPQLQTDQLIKLMSRRLLRNRPFFLLCSVVPNSSETPSSGCLWIGILLLQLTYCECILQPLASGSGLGDFLLLFIYCLLFLKMQLLGLPRLAVFISFEDSDGAGRGCVSRWQAVCVCGWLLQNHVVKSLLASTRRWAQLIPRPGGGESEVNALGTSPLSPTFFWLLEALYLIRLQNIPVRRNGRMAC